ncbi:MAG TPA: recombinase family protein [Armatimonadota bacterium]|nr:recombinase family protein [Armatimonadota bacterium]
MARAVGYIRVSTREQAEEGVSLAMQARRIAAACQERGWELAEVYSDAGWSGARLDRPALQRLLSALETDAVDALVVWKLDRLGRRSWWQQRLVEEVLLPRGIGFVSLTESFDIGTSHGRMVLGVLSGVGQYERDLIAERTAEGLREVSAQGRWSGRPPYGYRLQEGVLVPHPQEAIVVREAFRLYVEEGQSMSRVARELTRVTGRIWPAQQVSRVLGRRTYMGGVKHGEMGGHEPLVDQPTWERTQEIIARRRSAGGERRCYLFSRLLRCWRCGYAMIGRWVFQRWRRVSGEERSRIYRGYVCGKRRALGPQACQGQSIMERKLVRLLASALREMSAQANLGTVQVVPGRERDRSLELNLRQQLVAIPARRGRVVDLATRALITEQDLQAQLAALEREQAEGERIVRQLEREYRASPRQVRRMFRDLGALLESDEPLDRKRLLLVEMLEAVTISPAGDISLTLRYAPAKQ